MIFLVNQSNHLNLDLFKLNQEKDLDIFVWNSTNQAFLESQSSISTQSLSSQDILLSLKASLRESRFVLVTNGRDIPNVITHDLKKQRLFIKSGEYIFFSPRASFFFKPPLGNIILNSFSELEAYVQKWGK